MAAFTTIATAAALTATAASTGMSFSQMGKQRRLQKEAESEAERAMADARKRLEVNVYEKLGVAKLPYAQAREAALVQGAMATEAARESERGAAATAGRVQMAQQEQQATIAALQEQEILDLNKLVATEEGRLLDIGTQLNLEEVAGAQMAAANAEERANQALTQGMQGFTSLATQAAEAAPLFAKASATTQKQAVGGMQFSPEEFSAFERAGGRTLKQGEFSSLDFEKIGQMSNAEFKDWRRGLTPQQQAMVFRNAQYGKNIESQMNPFYFYR